MPRNLNRKTAGRAALRFGLWGAWLIACAGQATAQIQVLAVSSSAGFTSGLPGIGSLASIGLTGLTGIQGVQSAPGYPLPYELAGVSVTVSGSPAPILAVADMGYYQQINIQVPAPQPQAPGMVTVSQSGAVGQLGYLSYESGDNPGWGVFFADSSGYGAFQHADYTPVTTDHPAQPGEIVAAYCTNLASYSDVVNAPPVGYPAQANPLPLLNPARSLWTTFAHLTVDGISAEVLYAGLTPGSVGVFQINFRIPDGTTDGDALITATTDDSSCYGAGSLRNRKKSRNWPTSRSTPRANLGAPAQQSGQSYPIMTISGCIRNPSDRGSVQPAQWEL